MIETMWWRRTEQARSEYCYPPRHCGMRWRSDYVRPLKLGEAVAMSVLRDQPPVTVKTLKVSHSLALMRKMPFVLTYRASAV